MSESQEWFAFLSYGVGHVLNDLVASMWFTYALIFYHYVLRLSNIKSGTVILVGQLTDAIATAIIGMLSDNVSFGFIDRYGRRKLWHLFGSILMFIGLPFAFLPPIWSQFESSEKDMCLYYCFFVVLFQIGWASIENSHMALASDLTTNRDKRTALLSIRYSFTVFSNILVYVVTWIVLRSSHSTEAQFGPTDRKGFQVALLIITIVGTMTTIIFHIGVHEPSMTNRSRELSITGTETEKDADRIWSIFKCFTLYQTAVVYMCSRIFVNMTLVRFYILRNCHVFFSTYLYKNKVFLPMYLHGYLKLDAAKLALLPLMMFLSSFGMSLMIKTMNMKLVHLYSWSFTISVLCILVLFRKWLYICLLLRVYSNYNYW
ncbi:major facilitator superfamily domain-containing protein 12-like isoform X2 [Adelges cooleyi]|uniref:major facilitator superfamily domain-containing protein 12-like isoform X2 n=1 Tax=Adelges cooleyi TaxID=133065 RepID=UPI00217FDBFF|nr:major facilitator superfamily domain-containing protein 12-like isoform X2 [Adelges cooleyi]